MDVVSLDEEAVFHVARHIRDPEARSVYLLQVCGNHEALRENVTALLRAFEEQGDFLESPAFNRHPTMAVAGAACPPERPGTVIGPYQLLEVTGEGGMGTVYLAEQTTPVRRRVALKVIKPGMDTRQVVARFEAERQALALMDHPNIARVLDGGATESGRPYFVMELVRGIPITEYCDREQLPVRDRLELFVQVCRAVQHAHQKGVIHRDLKPSNVLVTAIDGGAVPKVIDFGVAKATGPNLIERTFTTGFHQFVGTPLYMSPEQADLTGVDVDTRSDVYSLGVLLYELLTGTTPFDREGFRVAAFDEVRRIVREVEPPKPSARLGTLGAALATVSAVRKEEPRHLGRTLRGELDWIVMRALEKDRNRRYETANGLASDVTRYLNDQPVEACPPSGWYRSLKFARRNRATLVSAAFVALALVAGTAGSLWQAVRATRAEARAEEHRRRSERHLYAFSLRQAQETIEQGEVERAQERLATLRDELGETETSDFGWRYLHRLATREVETVVRHAGNLGPIKLSPDGTLLASGDNQGAVAVTELSTGRVRHRLNGHDGSVDALVFSPDGLLLGVGSQVSGPSTRRAVAIWDLRAGQRVGQVGPFEAAWTAPPVFLRSGRRLAIATQAMDRDPITVRLFDLGSRPAQPVPGRTLEFQPGYRVALDATSVASQPCDGPFTVFDTETLQKRWSVSGGDLGHSWPVLSDDGRRVGTEDPTHVVIWETATGRALRRLPRGEGPGRIASYTLSRDGKTLLAQSESHRLTLIDLDDPTRAPRPLEQENPEHYSSLSPTIAPDSTKVAALTFDRGDRDGPVLLWDSATGRRLGAFPGRTQGRTLLVFAPGGDSLFLNGGDDVQRWWFSRPRVEASERLAGHRDEAWSVAFSPRGTVLATGSDDTEADDTLKLWDPATGRLLTGWRADPGTVAALAFSPDGHTLATGSLDPAVNLRLWDVDTRRLVADLKGHAGNVRSVAYAPDGRTLASAGNDRTVRLWSVASARPLATLKGHTDVVRKVAFSPDGLTLASASNDQTVRLWEVAPGREARVFAMSKKCSSVDFSPDGRTLAAADEGGDITLWDVATGRLQRVIHGEPTRLLALAFAPDGRTAAAAGLSGTIRVWDVLTGQELLTLRGHSAQVNGLRYSPDGLTLASCGHDGAVRLWRAGPPPDRVSTK